MVNGLSNISQQVFAPVIPERIGGKIVSVPPKVETAFVPERLGGKIMMPMAPSPTVNPDIGRLGGNILMANPPAVTQPPKAEEPKNETPAPVQPEVAAIKIETQPVPVQKAENQPVVPDTPKTISVLMPSPTAVNTDEGKARIVSVNSDTQKILKEAKINLVKAESNIRFGVLNTAADAGQTLKIKALERQVQELKLFIKDTSEDDDNGGFIRWTYKV